MRARLKICEDKTETRIPWKLECHIQSAKIKMEQKIYKNESETKIS